MTTNTIIFNEVSYTENSIKDLSTTQLVDLWNEIIDADSSLGAWAYITRFTDRATGQKRVWNLLKKADEVISDQDGKALEPITTGVVEVTYPTEDDLNSDVDLVDVVKVEIKQIKKAPKKSVEKRTTKGTNIKPKGVAPIACREFSKQSILVDCLVDGATMAQLVTALSGGKKPWTEQTIKSGFGWDLKQKGYGVRSELKNGVETFFLVVPEGYSIPAHYPKATK